MILNLSAPLAVALKVVERVGSGEHEDPQAGIPALCFVCDFVPEGHSDADALLEIAKRLLREVSDARLPIIEAQAAILGGYTVAAVTRLLDAAVAARGEGEFIVERLCLNVAAGPYPAILAYRPLLPWERPTLH